MSYSFSKKAATKGELEIFVRDELAKIPVAQPVHKVDINEAFNAAKSLIDLMSESPTRDIVCSVSGSIWKNDDGVQNVSVNITVGMTDRNS
jgi:hypothetical protein